MDASRIGSADVVSFARHLLDIIPSASLPLIASARLPGLELEARLDDAALAEAIDRNLAQAAGPSAASKRMRIFVAHPGMNGVPPPPSWSGDYRPHDVDRLLRQSGLRGSHFHDLRFWQFLDVETGTGVQLMQEPGGYPPWETSAPLRPFLHWFYATRGMRLTHCGTLGIDGSGILLAGAGGSGKSGTVIAGLLAGLQSIGDDYVLLDAGNGVTGYPVFSSLKQDPAGFERLGLAGRLAPRPLNWQGKYAFRIGELNTGPQPSSMRMKALAVPVVANGGKTTIEPIPRREAMLALAPSAIHQMPGERDSGFAFFSRVANSLPCYRLSLGRDPAEVAAAVRGFLERAP